MSKDVFILSKNLISTQRLEEQLSQLGYRPESHVELATLLEAKGIDCAMAVIVDKMAGDNEAEKWISELRRLFPRHCLLLLISNRENHLLVNYVKAGVTDLIHKPWHPLTVSLRLKAHSLARPSRDLLAQKNVFIESNEEDSLKHAS